MVLYGATFWLCLIPFDKSLAIYLQVPLLRCMLQTLFDRCWPTVVAASPLTNSLPHFSHLSKNMFPCSSESFDLKLKHQFIKRQCTCSSNPPYQKLFSLTTGIHVGFVPFGQDKIPGVFQVFSRSVEIFQGFGTWEKLRSIPLKHRNTHFSPSIPSFDALWCSFKTVDRKTAENV